MRKKVLLLGFGYTAQHLAKLLLKDNYTIVASSRDQGLRHRWQGPKVRMIDFSLDAIRAELGDVDHILSSIPPNEAGADPSLELLSSSLLTIGTQLKWVGYLSSTAVYGDHQGDWVDENTACINSSPRAERRINAENAWLSLYHQKRLPVHIFRLAGIYGPDRNNLAKIQSGDKLSIVKPGQVFSRIHVADIARALVASMVIPTPGEVYNVCDDEPAASQAVDAFAAKLLDAPIPAQVPLEQAKLSPMARDFYCSNRRVSNAKIKQMLNFELRYPSYREGLSALKKEGLC